MTVGAANRKSNVPQPLHLPSDPEFAPVLRRKPLVDLRDLFLLAPQHRFDAPLTIHSLLNLKPGDRRRRSSPGCRRSGERRDTGSSGHEPVIALSLPCCFRRPDVSPFLPPLERLTPATISREACLNRRP